jgi:hypothetical protein
VLSGLHSLVTLREGWKCRRNVNSCHFIL